MALEHSGYDLLNIGDAAMLKATVTRLQNRWPPARLQIITTSRERRPDHLDARARSNGPGLFGPPLNDPSAEAVRARIAPGARAGESG